MPKMKRRRLNIRHNVACFSEKKQRNLIAWWSIKILLDLRGWKRLERDSTFTSNPDILLAIGLEHLEDKELSKKQLFKILSKQKERLNNQPQTPNEHLENNIKKIADYIGLNGVERQLLLFAVILEGDNMLQEVTDTLGELNAEGVVGVLSKVLDLPTDEVREALSKQNFSSKSGLLDIHKKSEPDSLREIIKRNLLSRSGILRLKRSGLNEIRYKLDVLEGLAETLYEPDVTVETLLQSYFTLAGKPKLKKNDYLHVADNYSLIQEHLAHVCAQQTQGANIIVYGPPGTGKTEFAKSVAKTLGFNLYEVNIGDEERPFSKPKRIRAFQLANISLHAKRVRCCYLMK